MKKLLFALLLAQRVSLLALIDGAPMPLIAELDSNIPAGQMPSKRVTTSPLAPIKNGADRLTAFKKMANKHKASWFQLEKEFHTKKYDLLEKHHTQWSDFGTTNITDLNALNNWAAKDKDAFFDTQLKKAITLYEEQNTEWTALYDQHIEEAKTIAEKNQQELMQFKTRIKE